MSRKPGRLFDLDIWSRFNGTAGRFLSFDRTLALNFESCLGGFFKFLKKKKMNPFIKLKEMKTLLVDDDELIRDSLIMAFQNQGCFMQAVETAEDGLRALKKERFDIVISDLRLPGITGLEFLELAKSFQPKTVSVLITAYRDNDFAIAASSIGVNDFIEKPFSVRVLAETLARLVKKSRIIEFV